ncbi:sulfurtransferase TusA family protein [Roseomonas sp. CECT 9278]|uniref:sulfurtransferase TusA family protein n=1 Tax=Roseomonas sp. CECT 9278 TaxID=2845823 RepID=UPI001E3498C4|nr:sulfurtransferase TusA family protein [Roseomonas sp. CECT 9278]
MPVPPASEEVPEASTLDITAETCPMTFVRVRLALDRLPPGALLAVLLAGEEPRRNVPRTAAEQGHLVVSQAELPGGVMRLVLRRKG